MKPSEVPSSRRWLKWVGLRRRAAPKRLTFIPVVPNRFGWVLIVLLMFGGGAVAFAEYSMQPDFCRSCHIMEPYYTAWHQSKHRNVPCADCHFEPGFRNTLKGKWQASSQAVKYITNTYGSKPHAEIRDASCMRSGCHEKRLLEGKVAWNVPTQRGGQVTIRFDHTPHLAPDRRGKQLRCVSCHSQMVQGQHIVVTLDTCFLCHFKGVKHGRNDQTIGGCQACHEAPQQEIRLATGMFAHRDYIDRGVTCDNCHSEVVSGDGAVPRQVCWNCHNQPADIARYDQPADLHAIHVTRVKVECSSCHVQIQHSLSAALPQGGKALGVGQMLDNNGACGQCHERSHLGPAELYRGTGARGVPEMPSPMYRAQVDCIACHKTRQRGAETAEVSGQTYLGAQQACNDCHGTKYDGALEAWRASVADLLERAEASYASASAALDRPGLQPMEELRIKRLLDDAGHNIRLVKLGHGVHNVNYATAALNMAMTKCRQARLGPGADSATTPAPEGAPVPKGAPDAEGTPVREGTPVPEGVPPGRGSPP